MHTSNFGLHPEYLSLTKEHVYAHHTLSTHTVGNVSEHYHSDRVMNEEISRIMREDHGLCPE